MNFSSVSNNNHLWLLLFVPLLFWSNAEWGFYGHRQLNRLAVFTLPMEMQPLYKPNIAYITEHAVDPDKRRYAAKQEAVRHYIDLDHFGRYPFQDLPRRYLPAIVSRSEVWLKNSRGDTLRFAATEYAPLWEAYLRSHYDSIYQEGFMSVPCDSLRGWGIGGLDCQYAAVVDELTPYGIVPYHLQRIQGWLTDAFRRMDRDRILQLSAEMGHYVADAHVPLHTTVNYNGQLTNQLGIHAFWESRLPELFAEEQYDNFVGRATYIEDPENYYWDIVLASHVLVDSVLNIEKRLSRSIPEDQHYCYEERLGRNVRIPCRDYSARYHQELNGMVEDRWRASIQAIGSAWYTAWVDAGKPNLRILDGTLQPTVNQEPIQVNRSEGYRQHDY